MKIQLEIKNECDRISNLINEAFINGDGANITLVNSSKLKYNMGFFGTDKIIIVKEKDIICRLPINLTTNGSHYTFNVTKGSISILNINNTIQIKNI